MSVRILLDNSALGRLDEVSEAERAVVDEALGSKAVALYLQLDLVVEALSVVDSGAQHLLQERACWLSQRIGGHGGRVLSRWNDIMASELKGATQVFLEQREVEGIRATLVEVCRGGGVQNIRKLKDFATEHKRRQQEAYKPWKRNIAQQLQATKGQRMPGAPADFEEFLVAHVRPVGIDALEKIFQFPLASAEMVLSKPHVYPYFHAFIRTLGAMMYSYAVENRAVEWGGTWDSNQLVYMVGLDWLVTEDPRLAAWFRQVFVCSLEKRVLDLSSFLRELGSIEEGISRRGVVQRVR